MHGKIFAILSSSCSSYHVFIVGELVTIFSLPPIPNEKIISFRIVPTYDRSAKGLGPDEDVTITPALLLLTQRQNQEDSSKFDRHVKIIRCPNVPLSEWALEIGALPDPRKATEVQPAAAEVTVRFIVVLIVLIFPTYSLFSSSVFEDCCRNTRIPCL